MSPIPVVQIFTFLFLMLGPIKIIGPFAKITRVAEPSLPSRSLSERRSFQVWRRYSPASLAKVL